MRAFWEYASILRKEGIVNNQVQKKALDDKNETVAFTPSRVLFGGDWNPEQWPEETWEHDLELLSQAHINEVTLNVFSWSLLQPDEATYDFTKLDKIIDLVEKHGFSFVLATSTAALPAWLVRKYPDVIRTDVDGKRHVFGGRHNFCPNSRVFREFSRKLTARLAQRYSTRKGLVAWHIGNEYGGGGGLCYCQECARAFRVWLRYKYGTLEALNEAWCSNFWSHTIISWDDVVPPVSYGDGIGTEKSVISGLLLDYRKFQNESQLMCYLNERGTIRAFDSTTPITTNLMGTFKDLDYFTWGRAMDVVSWDNYPGMTTPPSYTAMCHDLMRSVGGGKPFMLMEQTPNQQNWFPFCKVKRPGEVRALSWQAVAHGADTVQFFQMRQSLGGCERFHGAVIGHDGTNQTRVFRETTRLGEELERTGSAFLGSRVQARVAVIFDWPSYWSLEGCVGPTQGLRYPDEVHRFYQALFNRAVAVDMLPATASLEQLQAYDMVVAPVLIQVSKRLADDLATFVRDGGTLVTGYMSGIHDERDLVVPGGYPGYLREIAGVWVEEIDALAPEETISVEFAANEPGESALASQGSIVASIMHLESAEALAVYGGDEFYAGTPAVSVRSLEQGSVYYVGSALQSEGMQRVIDRALESAGIKTLPTVPGVDISVRTREDGTRIVYVINTGNEPKRLVVPQFAALQDLLSDTAVDSSGVLELEPFAVRMLSDLA